MHDLYAYNVLMTNTCNMYKIYSDPIPPHHTDSATLSNRFSGFFQDKIQSIKANIVIDASIPPPTMQELRYTGPRLVVFQPVTTIEVQKLILSTPNKSCDLNKVILFQHV